MDLDRGVKARLRVVWFQFRYSKSGTASRRQSLRPPSFRDPTRVRRYRPDRPAEADRFSLQGKLAHPGLLFLLPFEYPLVRFSRRSFQALDQGHWRSSDGPHRCDRRRTRSGAQTILFADWLYPAARFLSLDQVFWQYWPGI